MYRGIIILTALATLLLVPSVEASSHDPMKLILLDASASMSLEYQGQRKDEFVSKALAESLENTKSTTPIALWQFGGNYNKEQKELSCSDATPLTPFHQNNNLIIQKKLSEVRGNGYSGLAHALSSIEQFLNTYPEDQQFQLLIISDGNDNCGGDPAVIAAMLKESIPNIELSILGIDLDKSSKQKFENIAQATDGTFIEAQQLSSINKELHEFLPKQTEKRQTNDASYGILGTRGAIILHETYNNIPVQFLQDIPSLKTFHIETPALQGKTLLTINLPIEADPTNVYLHDGLTTTIQSSQKIEPGTPQTITIDTQTARTISFENASNTLPANTSFILTTEGSFQKNEKMQEQDNEEGIPIVSTWKTKLLDSIALLLTVAFTALLILIWRHQYQYPQTPNAHQ